MVCRFVFSTNAMLNNYKTYYIVYLIKKLFFIKSASIHAYFSTAERLVDTCIQSPYANLSNKNTKVKEITPRL